MIRIDQRIGSGELEPLFKPYGLKVHKTKLDYGDFDFEGNGPKGKCAIVFERKRIEDLLDSMQSGRLTGHQLPGISESYDYGYLLIEGAWRANADGLLEISNGRGGWTARGLPVRAVTSFVMGLCFRAGLVPWKTFSPVETVAFIVDQYRMWNDKLWDEHTSHLTVYAPAGEVGGGGFGLSLVRREVTMAEKVAMQLPGLDSKAKYAVREFGDVFGMANANESQWAGMPWKTRKGQARKLGAIGGKKIYDAIRGK